ncbi:hypothetical protein COA09_19985 [Bacillus cereus]|nr:hypothetical protein COL00_00135 [Bacillus cereus]PGQ09694.1 hypothetical protein COA09_19985 [Bacillus cereus]PGS43111.1 hypothetical protein COC67_31670 [Bacillus cereus]PGV09077.1 hypothetical protein COD77_15135 [Bacillus cereus]
MKKFKMEIYFEIWYMYRDSIFLHMNNIPLEGKKNKAECAGFFVLLKFTDGSPFYIDKLYKLKN